MTWQPKQHLQKGPGWALRDELAYCSRCGRGWGAIAVRVGWLGGQFLCHEAIWGEDVEHFVFGSFGWGLCLLKWRCCMMLLSATLLVILVGSIGSFWQLRWYWFRHAKSRTYAYGIISHMTTVCRTITREHQRCCYQQVRSKKHFVHPTFPLLIIQSMAAREPTTYIAWRDFRRWQAAPASIPWKPCLVCCVPPLRCFGIPKPLVISKSHGKWRVDSRRLQLGCWCQWCSKVMLHGMSWRLDAPPGPVEMLWGSLCRICASRALRCVAFSYRLQPVSWSFREESKRELWCF